MRSSFLLILIAISYTVNSQIVTDVDGNTYHIVTIGNQTWLKENLKTTKLRDGTPINTISNIWGKGRYTWYNGDSINNNDIYGVQYNYPVVYSWNLGYVDPCPSGWHVPSLIEWDTLINYLGGKSAARRKLKETGTGHWLISDSAASNSSGFTALPGGYNNTDLGQKAYFRVTDHKETPGEVPGGPGSRESWYIFIDNDTLYSSLIWDSDQLPIRCMCDSLIKTSIDTIPSTEPDTVPSTKPDTITDKIPQFSIDKVEVFPNPAYEKLTLKNILSNNFTVHIYDLQGHILMKRQNIISPVDISNLPKGIYTIKIITNKEVLSAKFIKE